MPYAHYDKRGYKTVSVEEGYARWAAKYGDFYDCFDIEVFVRSPLLTERVPGARVVDLACGTGRIGKWLKETGAAAVVGVDRAPEMLAHAEARGVYERTLIADVTATGLPDGSFGGALTSMALCHVPDLDAFFREAARIVEPSGWLATLDYHPFFMMMGIPTHFDPIEGGGSIAIENYVHPHGAVFEAARDHGFIARELVERFVDAQWLEKMPRYERYSGWPITCFWAFTR